MYSLKHKRRLSMRRTGKAIFSAYDALREPERSLPVLANPSGALGHLLLSGGLLARNSGAGPLLFSAKSMAICMSSTHLSISGRELGEMTSDAFSGHREVGVGGKRVPSSKVRLPGGHHDGLALAPQGQAVGDAPLLFTFLHL